MKPWTSRWACMALVGLSLTWAGCGGSKDADESADAPADEGASVAAADAAPAGKADAPAPTPTPDQQPKEATAEAAPAAAPATKGDSSATSELLALANNSATPADAPAAATDAQPAAGGQGANPMPIPGAGAGYGAPVGGPAGAPPGYAAPGGAAAAGYGAPATGGANPPAGYPTGPGAPGAPIQGGDGVAAAPGGRAGIPGIPGGGPGFEGPGAGGAGDVGGGPSGGIYGHQFKAVREFLTAVKAKDKDALVEAVALRAPQEAVSPSNKKLFTSIREQSISDAELDHLAKAFEGFQITSVNDARSTGRLGVTLSKSEDGDTLRRTITVRKEAKGWKVVDFSGQGRIDGFSTKKTKKAGSR